MKTRSQTRKTANSVNDSPESAGCVALGRQDVSEQASSGRHPVTARKPSKNKLGGSQTRENPENGSPNSNSGSSQPRQRCRWSEEQYEEVVRCYYMAKHHRPHEAVTRCAFQFWKQRNSKLAKERSNVDANRLATIRRDIVNNNRILVERIEQIENSVKQSTPPDSEKVDTLPSDSNNFAVPPESERESLPATTTDSDVNAARSLRNEIVQRWRQVSQHPVHDRMPLPFSSVNKNLMGLIQQANAALDEIIKEQPGLQQDITAINHLIYATAATITEPRRPSGHTLTTKHAPTVPRWKRRLYNKVAKLRKDLSIVHASVASTASTKTKQKELAIRRRHRFHPTMTAAEVQETLKQKIQAKAQRIRRYEKRVKFFRQNKTFQSNARRFYRELNGGPVQVEAPPDKEKVKSFWQGIWGVERKHNLASNWLPKIRKNMRQVPKQKWDSIKTSELASSLKHLLNWKTPGIDRIPNFWLKKLSSTHAVLAQAFTHLIEHPSTTPEWLTKGNTLLLPKSSNTKEAKNYRPITCLPTIYKLLTSILTHRAYAHLDANNLLPEEQKGCRKGSYGCKDQLLINKMITEHATKHRQNLSTAWIDYRKAFDSVPHSWLLEVCQLHGLNQHFIDFLKETMPQWKIDLSLHHSQGTILIPEVNIKTGIFQGDSLSPLLFCLALAPLSALLNDNNSGYEIKQEDQRTVVSHLFYMDDLKIYSKTEEQLDHMIAITKEFSADIQMEFGLDKCARVFVRKGKHVTSPVVPSDNSEIKHLEPEDSYKYLGIEESMSIHHKPMKEKVKKEYIRRLRMILKSELSSPNKIKAINSLAVPVLLYTFGVINWTKTDIQGIDRKTRKILTMYSMHHPKADIHRLYISRKEGGRGLMQLELNFEAACTGLYQYLSSQRSGLLTAVFQHETKRKGNSVSSTAKRVCQEAGMELYLDKVNADPVSDAKTAKEALKLILRQRLHQQAVDKPLHGQYLRSLQDHRLDKRASISWLNSAGLKGPTEGFIIAAQDQAISTNYIKNKIWGENIDPKCRLCKQFDETVEHILSGCPMLAKKEYLDRHNKVARYLHWLLCKQYDMEAPGKWYEHTPENVVSSENVVLIWDTGVQTDNSIPSNRPDIIIKNKLERTCMLIDVSVPADRNIYVKRAEKVCKYKDLEIEIQKMWGVRTSVVPLIVGALGAISSDTPKDLARISTSASLYQVQKQVLLSSAFILRRFL